MNSNEIKEMVKEKYGAIARNSNASGCCGPSSCSPADNKIVDYTVIQDDYTELNGYVPDADLGLGCGLPTEHAGIKKGDTVIDLGSGAGNDVFIARSITGPEGKVIGIDMTEDMINKAKNNNAKAGFDNVEFKLGEIENIPLPEDTADVVVSNCVLNLVPDKVKAFEEIYRILKPGGHFCISDIVLVGELPDDLKQSAEMYAGCVAGAMQMEDYLAVISKTGFLNTEVKKRKIIELPENLLRDFLSEEGVKEYKEKIKGIFSITVTGYKI